MAEWMTIVKQRNEMTRRGTELGYRYSRNYLNDFFEQLRFIAYESLAALSLVIEKQ